MKVDLGRKERELEAARVTLNEMQQNHPRVSEEVCALAPEERFALSGVHMMLAAALNEVSDRVMEIRTIRNLVDEMTQSASSLETEIRDEDCLLENLSADTVGEGS